MMFDEKEALIMSFSSRKSTHRHPLLSRSGPTDGPVSGHLFNVASQERVDNTLRSDRRDVQREISGSRADQGNNTGNDVDTALYRATANSFDSSPKVLIWPFSSGRFD